MNQDFKTIYLVDDVPQRRDLLKDMLSERDYRIMEADSAEKALELVNLQAPDMIITETELPARSGLYLLQEVKNRELDTEVILVTHNASSYNLLQALRYGAFDFIVRPVDTSEILFSVIDRALNQLELRRQVKQLVEELAQKNQALTQSLAMMKVLNVSIERVNRAHEVGDLLSQLLDAALDALKAKHGLLALQKSDTDSFGIKISRGLSAEFCQAHPDHLPNGLLLDIARSGNPVQSPSELPPNLAKRISSAERDLFTDPGLLAVPLHHRKRTIGILALFGHPDGSPFTEENQHFLIQLAHHAALALEKAGIIHQLKKKGANGNGQNKA